MSIASIAATGSQSGVQSSQSSLSQLSEDYTRFMTLLVAQIQNQDPLNPVDNTEFISQIAQLTQVEQSVLTNQYIADLSGRLSMSGALFTTALIGREVTVPSGEMQLSGGAATFSYKLDGSAKAVTAVVRDADGTIINEINLGAVEGGALKDALWNGKNAQGQQMPDGVYQISLRIDASQGGEAQSYETFSAWRVMGVSYADGETMLDLDGGAAVAANKIIRAS